MTEEWRLRIGILKLTWIDDLDAMIQMRWLIRWTGVLRTDGVHWTQSVGPILFEWNSSAQSPIQHRNRWKRRGFRTKIAGIINLDRRVMQKKSKVQVERGELKSRWIGVWVINYKEPSKQHCEPVEDENHDKITVDGKPKLSLWNNTKTMRMKLFRNDDETGWNQKEIMNQKDEHKRPK